MSLSVINNCGLEINGTIVSSCGKMTTTGGEIATYGYQFGTSNPPVNYVSVGSGSGIVRYNWSRNMVAAGTYYFRCYAYSPVSGYKYAAVQTAVITTVPIVSTTAASSITMTGCTAGGNVSSSGGLTVTSRGVDLHNSSDIFMKRFASGSGTGSYTVSITGLTEGTNYRVRAYAINSKGIGYGTSIAFTSASRPTVTTTSITNINGTIATGGGNVTNGGTTAVTAKGVCWALTSNPTTANSKTVDGTGTGSYSSTLTGLTEGRTYYVRAYATNSFGTNYGTQTTFTSDIDCPSFDIDEDLSQYPDLGWSGGSTTSSWSGATHLKVYQKLASAPSYTLVDTIAITPQTFPLPVAYWKFNETGGTTSRNECNGTPINIGVGQLVAGKEGNSLKTMANDYTGHADTGIIFGANDCITVNFWINLSYTAAVGTAGATSYAFSTTDTGRTQGITYAFRPWSNQIYYYLVNSSGGFANSVVTFSGVTTDDEWKMFTFVEDGNYVRVYMNGVYATSLSGAANKRNTPIATAIIGGLRYNSGDGCFQRITWVDEMSVFPRMLSQAEITALYTGVTQTMNKIAISNYAQLPNTNYNVYGAFTNGVIESAVGNVRTINNIVANPTFTLSNTLKI